MAFGQLVLFAAIRLFFRNFRALGFIQIANYGLPILTMPYLVRTLGIANYGLLAFAQSLSQYAKLIIDYGFDLSATRAISLAQDDPAARSRAFSAVLWIRLGLAIVCFTLLLGAVAASSKLRSYWSIHLLTFLSAAASSLSTICFFQGIERMEYITYLFTASRLIITASIFLFYPLGKRLLPDARHRWRHPSSCSTWQASGSPPAASTWLSTVPRRLKSGAACAKAGTPSSVGFSRTPIPPPRTFSLGLFNNEDITGRFVLAARLSEVAQMFPLASLLQALYPASADSTNKTPRRASVPCAASSSGPLSPIPPAFSLSCPWPAGSSAWWPGRSIRKLFSPSNSSLPASGSSTATPSGFSSSSSPNATRFTQACS
jgi:PST family polysaccharide transporter